MNKEIRDYQESMFFGLNLRQFICSLLAVLAAVGIYFGVRESVGEKFTGWLCMSGAVPFAACGFFKYHGMTAEQFLWAFIKSEFLYPKRLLFRSEDLYYSCMEETILQGERTGKNAGKLWKKRGNRKLEKRKRQSIAEKKKYAETKRDTENRRKVKNEWGAGKQFVGKKSVNGRRSASD